MKFQHFTLLVLSLVLVTGCVSKKKYVTLQEQKKRSDLKVRELTTTNNELNQQLNKKTKEAKNLDDQLEKLKREYNDIKNQMLESNARKTSMIEDLNKQLSSLSTDNKSAKDSLQSVLGRLNKKEENYRQKQMELSSKIEDLKQIETALKEHKEALDELERFITHNFDKNSILSAYTLRETGMLYVTFNEGALFDEDGELSSEGKKALKILGTALENYGDTRFVSASNWSDELSEEQAWMLTKEKSEKVFANIRTNHTISEGALTLSSERINQQKVVDGKHQLAFVLYPSLKKISQFAD